jgi:tetratricopeptide (TPR) repeat protein
MEALEALQPELEDGNAIVYLLAAQAHLELQDYEAAQAMLERYDEVAPEPACQVHSQNLRYNGWVQLYNAAVEAYGAGRNDEALEAFGLANSFNPDLRSYSNAALLQAEMGDTEGAIATYREALQADISDPDPEQLRTTVRGLGDLLNEAGRGEEALGAYGDYLEDYPDDVVIQIRYALALSDQGREDEAAGIYAEVLGRDDLNPSQWIEVGVGLYNSRDYENASTAFSKAREGNPYAKEAMENYVNASVLAGRPGPVIGLADTLVTWYPYDEANYQLLASALARADMNDRAMEVMNNGETTDLIFHFVQMAPMSAGGYVIRGSFEAREASGTVQIPFEFLDASGSVVMTETLSTQAPPAGETGTFRLEVDSSVPLAGFRYKKTGA